MATKKIVTKRTTKGDAEETHPYGQKSGPSQAGVKEMSDEQSEPSSKDELHSAKSKLKLNAKKAK
jgi:hypothetical protein